jgi:hypothetical protein
MTDSSNSASRDVLYYFVDESGDPKLFGRRGEVVIGNNGVSKYFMLGKLDVADPIALHADLEVLRAELLTDPYFKDVPSLKPERKKTPLAFHANNDLPEVRREVYKVLLKPARELKFSVVIRDKMELVAYVTQQNERDGTYRYRENEVYDSLVTELFRTFHPVVDLVDICYATRGRKPRSQAFEAAISKAERIFEKQYRMKPPNAWRVRPSVPPMEAGLQAVDYFLWAVQRFFERGEERFVELIWPKVHWVHDLDRIEDGHRGVRYDKNRPLSLAERSRKKRSRGI